MKTAFLLTSICALMTVSACTTTTSNHTGNPSAQDLNGTWQGIYNCAQGKTGLKLHLNTVDNGTVHGMFDFYPLPDNPYAKSGQYEVTGQLQGSQLVLQPVKWIQQPSHYIMVGLDGIVTQSRYSGSVPECESSFHLHKQ